MISSNDSQWIQDNHDNADVPNVSVTSPYRSAVLQCIAGYVVRMVRKRVNNLQLLFSVCQCGGCRDPPSLQGHTDRGGLVKASESDVRVCHETEKCF